MVLATVWLADKLPSTAAKAKDPVTCTAGSETMAMLVVVTLPAASCWIVTEMVYGPSSAYC
jgi:hypothetical protein